MNRPPPPINGATPSSTTTSLIRIPPLMDLGFDGKMLRKSMARRTVDYHPSVVNYLEDRVWKRDGRGVRALQLDASYGASLTLPDDMLDTQVSCVMIKFIRAALNKDESKWRALDVWKL